MHSRGKQQGSGRPNACRTRANAGRRQAGRAPGSKGERGRVHCKHVQLVFTMFSQPPPRQYNPPLEARTVCQENKKSQQEGGRKERRGGLQKVAAQAAGRWKLGTRGEGRRRRHHQWGLLDEEMAFGGQWQQTDGWESIVSTGAQCPPPRFTRCSKHTWGEGRGTGNLGKRSALPGSAASHKSPPPRAGTGPRQEANPCPAPFSCPPRRGKAELVPAHTHTPRARSFAHRGAPGHAHVCTHTKP